MNSLERFRQKMEMGGCSLREERIKDSRLLLKQVFFDDPSFIRGIYFWEFGKFGADAYYDSMPIAIRLYDRKFSNANGWMVQFQTLHNTPILQGDILFDSNSDSYFICTEVFDIDSIHWQGKLTLCNWILKWQKEDGTILEYPCVDQNTTQYNSGETANRVFTVGTSQHMLTLPCDENTVLLDTPQRFFMDNNRIHPTPYIVTQNDTTSYKYGTKGLVRVTIAQDVYRPDKDRIDLGICDYISPDDLATDNSNDILISKSVISYDEDIIRSGGDVHEFVAHFYDAGGNEVSGILPRWEIVCDFIDDLEVYQSDNYLRIGIDNDDYVDEEFKIILSDQNGDYSSSLIIKVESLYG